MFCCQDRHYIKAEVILMWLFTIKKKTEKYALKVLINKYYQIVVIQFNTIGGVKK